ncbi:hypothetical protein [Undibacterium fentianense]|uniref:Uncharacterized protein n=1 Tax=Undibacterium fentianense TaxID=2828728 RepID=A0A941ID21_9BURK|nr:hypothetical protein [Undibacterium fentianense]MBR7799488.1 hypothetical protein [Undibacterium fentianense]
MSRLFTLHLLFTACLGIFNTDVMAQSSDIHSATPRLETKQYQLFEDVDKHQIRILDRSTKQTLRVLRLQNKQGKYSQLSTILHHQQRQSFILVLSDIAELWELSYDPKAEPVYQGWVHDYQMGEGIADTQLFAPRKTLLSTALDCFILDPQRPYVAGADQQGKFQIINLDIRRQIVEQQFAQPVYPCLSKLENTGATSVLHLKLTSSAADNTDTTSSVILIDMKTGKQLTR